MYMRTGLGTALVAVLLISACNGGYEPLPGVRKKVDVVDPVARGLIKLEYRQFRNDGTKCGCSSIENGNRTRAAWLISKYDQDHDLTYWTRESDRDSGAGELSRWTPVFHGNISKDDEVFVGCTLERLVATDPNTCQTSIEFSVQDPDIGDSFTKVSSDFAMFGTDQRFTDPVGSMVKTSEDGFVCETLCATKNTECPDRNMPDRSFNRLQNVLTTVLGSDDDRPVPMEEISRVSGIDTSACERNEISKTNGILTNTSKDGSSCVLEVSTGLSDLEINFPSAFTSQTLVSKTSTIMDFTQSEQTISLDHNVEDSILKGNIQYLKRGPKELIAMIVNGSARYCLKLY